MFKKDIYKKVLASAKNVTQHGQLNEKVLWRLKMTTSLYEHIEVTIKHYDDKNKPDFNNWNDVEGMGYGWAWVRYDEDRWHEMMSRMVSKESQGLLRDMDETYYLMYEDERGKVYHFITIHSTHRYDTIITFSNDELFF
jgi:hypothetical protein